MQFETNLQQHVSLFNDLNYEEDVVELSTVQGTYKAASEASRNISPCRKLRWNGPVNAEKSYD